MMPDMPIRAMSKAIAPPIGALASERCMAPAERRPTAETARSPAASSGPTRSMMASGAANPAVPKLSVGEPPGNSAQRYDSAAAPHAATVAYASPSDAFLPSLSTSGNRNAAASEQANR